MFALIGWSRGVTAAATASAHAARRGRR
jgi:hypothetical protein